jgi:hypothetical protein
MRGSRGMCVYVLVLWLVFLQQSLPLLTSCAVFPLAVSHPNPTNHHPLSPPHPPPPTSTTQEGFAHSWERWSTLLPMAPRRARKSRQGEEEEEPRQAAAAQGMWGGRGAGGREGGRDEG